ncbi:NeuD/PglB/VioB family sugar acetyltransferase [Paraburkholderia caledonica]|uniref:NeuD/PglB/VioB family sugar acetyltransferase n=1 Tax=Paraburkholderia caledonica TaxID=134536 RepID=UPI000369DA2D|nr:NeuD/PglB/VioB family sugar acetyltransferase [Paraburkholderia caledonica]
MLNNLFIYGAGGFGKEVMDFARRLNAVTRHWDMLSFVDDVTTQRELHGAPVYRFNDSQVQDQLGEADFVIAVGEPAGRIKLAAKLAAVGARMSALCDPSAVISNSAQLNEGVLIGVSALVSSDARVGSNACVNSSSIIGHDVKVGEHTVISSMVNLGGASVIGGGSYIGMGALIKEGVRIGSNTIIGMGSVVYGDVPDNVIALGNPARVARLNTDRKVFN